MLLYLGIDHSLTAFGVCAVAPDWGLDFARVRRRTWETKPDRSAAARRGLLAASVVGFIRQLGVAPGSVVAGIEGGIFHASKASSIRSQERLAGVVEHELWRLGIPLEIAELRSVRSTFMGRSAFARGAGAAAQELLGKVAPATRSWFEAELDAFLVANYLLSEAGETFVSCAPAEDKSPPYVRARRGTRTATSSPRPAQLALPLSAPRIAGAKGAIP